jgi:hypothetical protein
MRRCGNYVRVNSGNTIAYPKRHNRRAVIVAVYLYLLPHSCCCYESFIPSVRVLGCDRSGVFETVVEDFAHLRILIPV